MGVASDTLSFLKRGFTSGVEGVIEAVKPKETGVLSSKRIIKQFEKNQRDKKVFDIPVSKEKVKELRERGITEPTKTGVKDVTFSFGDAVAAQKFFIGKIGRGEDLTPNEQGVLGEANRVGFGQASSIALGFIGGLKLGAGFKIPAASKGLIVSNAADDVIKGYINKRISIGSVKQLKPGIKDKVYDSFQSIYTSTVDRFNPIVNATKIAKTRGAQILPGQNPELLARRYLGTKGIAETKLFWKTTDLTPQGNLKITGDGLSTLLKPVRNNLDDLRAMLVAERDIELATRTGKATIKGTTPAESGAVLNALKAKYGENFNTLQKASDDVRSYSRKAILDPLRDSGIISNKTYDSVIKSNQFYTPFNRVMNDLESKGFIGSNKDIFQPKGSPIKKIKGSDLQIIDPLESLIKDTYRVTDLVERTRVAKSITDLSASIPDLIQPVKTKVAPVSFEQLGPLATQAKKFNSADEFVRKNSDFIRLEEKGAKTLFDKPQGLFASFADRINPRIGDEQFAGGTKSFFKLNPEANVLKVSSDTGKVGVRGLEGEAAGARIINRLASTKIKQELKIAGNSLKETKDILFRDFPQLKGNKNLKFTDVQDVQEAYAGMLARKEGFDVVFNLTKETDALAKQFEEVVILNKGAVKTKSQLTEIFNQAKKGGQPIFRPVEFQGKNVISTFENGQKQFFKVSPELFKAMEGMTAGDSNIITKMLGLPTKALRAGAILNPEFALRNPIRDQMSAFIFSKYGFRPGIDPVAGLFNAIGKTETFNRWLAGGGAQSMFTSLDRISTQKTLQQVASKKLGALSPQGALNKLKGFVKEPLGPLRTLSEFSEEGTRVGAFRRAQIKGATNIEAIFESRDITLDFARIGSKTSALNKIIAFFNANVQGTDKLLRAFKEKPVQTNLKAIIGITIPSIALYLSQKDDPRYQEVPQWQKDLFWVIVPPGEDSPIIRVPKPFLLGVIYGTIPEKILQWLGENDPDALSTIPDVLLEGATPGFIPTAMLPLIENQANYSFFRDRPIVSQSLEGLPAEFQANTYTSETAKEIGKIIKKFPAKIENLVNGYFAGLGRYALDTSDFILEQVGLISPPPAPKKALADLPILRAFIVREPIGNSSESVNRFFKEFERISEQHRLASTLAKSGRIAESQAVVEEHPEIFLFKGLNGIVQDMSEIRKLKELVFQSQKLSPEDKQDRMIELDRMMTELAKQSLIIIEESGL